MQTPIRALIADDERQLREHLKKLLAQSWPELQICAEAVNGLEALEKIRSERPDIAFLDIRMPGKSGMEVANEAVDLCCIVFITAYDQFAVEAFEREAVDYLLKPVEPERLAVTVDRLKQRLAQRDLDPAPIHAVLEHLRDQLVPPATTYLKWIKVMELDDIRLIPVEEVLCFQAQDKYTVVQTVNGEHLIRKTIKSLAEELDPELFWQIHRSTVVNAARIEKVSTTFTGSYAVTLNGLPDKLPVSRRYQYRFKSM
jgi:DNA-binding LytR/AlgR family response regulator